MRLHTIGNYLTTARYDFLKIVEGQRLYAYVDTERIATVGIGINLEEHGQLILRELGFDLGGTVLTGAALTAEGDYITQLLNAFKKRYTPNNSPNNQAFSTFNAILWKRAFDPVYPHPDLFPRPTEFRLASSDVSRQVLNQTLDGYNVPGKTSPGYESVLDTWLILSGLSARQPDLMNRGSQERLALLSLAFNSRVYGKDQPGTTWNDIGLPTLLGPKLANALLNDDRAEAWYEIRYQSRGAAARRFGEAQLFGLYNDPTNITQEEAAGIYRMLQAHRDTIFLYEQTYGRSVDNQAGTQGDRIAQANNDFTSFLSIMEQGKVTTLQETLQPAKQVLLTYLRDMHPEVADYLLDTFAAPSIYWNPNKPDEWGNVEGAVLDASAFEKYYRDDGASEDLLVGANGADWLLGGKGDDVLIGADGDDVLQGGAGTDVLDGDGGADTLEGGDGADVLLGGAGNDVLIGGPGPDTLNGGSGEDLYLWRLGESPAEDTIIDEDGKGHFRFTGSTGMSALIGGTFVQDPTDPNRWVDATTSEIFLTHNSPWTLHLPGGETINLGESFDDGDFGIDLFTESSATAPEAPATTLTIVGDRAPIDADPNTPGVQYSYDALGNVVTDPEVPAPDRVDELYDSTGDDTLLAGGGNDVVWAERGGANLVDAGAGNDLVVAGAGADYLLGGAGDDALWAKAGADFVDGGDGTDYVDGGAGADWLRGGTGRDTLWGDGVEATATPDVLEGGADADFAYGQGGDDQVYGDQAIGLADAIAEGRTATGSAAQGDFLAGMDGADLAIGTVAKDLLSGGEGSDALDGDADGVREARTCPMAPGTTEAAPGGAPQTRCQFFHPKVTRGIRGRRAPARRMPRIRGATAQLCSDRRAGMRVASLRDDRGRGRRGGSDPKLGVSSHRCGRTTALRTPAPNPRPAVRVVYDAPTVVTAIPPALSSPCQHKVTPLGATRQAAPCRPLRPQLHNLCNVPKTDHRRRLTGPSACAIRAHRGSPGRGTARPPETCRCAAAHPGIWSGRGDRYLFNSSHIPFADRAPHGRPLRVFGVGANGGLQCHLAY